MESADIKKFGGLMLGLFLIMVVTAVTYIGAGYLKETTCEMNSQTGDEWYWQSDTCYNSSGDAQDLTAITKIGVVEGVIDIALGLLALVVLMAIFKVVIKTAKGFGGGYN